MPTSHAHGLRRLPAHRRCVAADTFGVTSMFTVSRSTRTRVGDTAGRGR